MTGGLYDDERPSADAWVDRLPARYRQSLSQLSAGFAAGELASSAASPPPPSPSVVVGSAIGVPVLVGAATGDTSASPAEAGEMDAAMAPPSSVAGVPVGRPVLFHDTPAARRSSRVAPAPLVTASSA